MVMEFRLPNQNDSLIVRAFLRAELTYLSFPTGFSRARSNTFSLFKNCCGSQVLGVQIVPYDRSFFIRLSGGRQILFKLHGNRSNVVLLGDDGVEELFKSTLKADQNLTLESLATHPDISKERFEELGGNAYKMLPQIGVESKAWLELRNYSALSLDEKWAVFQQLLTRLETGNFYLTLWDNRTQLLLFDEGKVEHSYKSAIEAAQGFARVIGYRFYTEVARREAAHELTKRRDQTIQNLEKIRQRRYELGDGQGYRQQADVLMANLHIFAQSHEAEVFNFYTNQQQRIVLKQGTTAQKMAEGLYRKSRNAHQELAKLDEQMQSRELLRQKLEGVIASLVTADTVKDIKTLMEVLGTRKERIEAAETLPYRAAEFQGWEIRIGKNAISNDAMLRSFSHKDDLWFHAKDVSGSHVLVVHKTGMVVPRPVIERAAAVAAWHSKKRNENLADVTVTPRKFVRKQKGAAAGAVRVEKERVILVEPKDI